MKKEKTRMVIKGIILRLVGGLIVTSFSVIGFYSFVYGLIIAAFLVWEVIYCFVLGVPLYLIGKFDFSMLDRLVGHLFSIVLVYFVLKVVGFGWDLVNEGGKKIELGYSGWYKVCSNCGEVNEGIFYCDSCRSWLDVNFLDVFLWFVKKVGKVYLWIVLWVGFLAFLTPWLFDGLLKEKLFPEREEVEITGKLNF